MSLAELLENMDGSMISPWEECPASTNRMTFHPADWVPNHNPTVDDELEDIMALEEEFANLNFDFMATHSELTRARQELLDTMARVADEFQEMDNEEDLIEIEFSHYRYPPDELEEFEDLEEDSEGLEFFNENYEGFHDTWNTDGEDRPEVNFLDANGNHCNDWEEALNHSVGWIDPFTGALSLPMSKSERCDGNGVPYKIQLMGNHSSDCIR